MPHSAPKEPNSRGVYNTPLPAGIARVAEN